MGSGVLKTIVVLILLVALAFVAGSMAADGVKQAMVPSLLALGVLVLLCLGHNCWILAFIIPPFLSLLEFGGGKIPMAHLLSVVLLGYWLLMGVMGYTKITWNKLPVIDFTVFIFVVYFLSTWFANPVKINAFVNHITDEGYALVGGAEYIWCLTALMTFIFISILPLTFERLGVVLKWVVVFSIIAAFLVAVKTLISPQLNDAGERVALGEAIQGSRFGGFADLGNAICLLMFCKYSILGIICSPWKLALCLAGGVGIALSGFRSMILNVVILCALIQFYRRQFVTLIFCALCAYAGVLGLSHTIPMERVPLGIKRVFSSVPGVDIKDKKLASTAQHSLDWRYQMWDWAMDSSKGYIKNYVWGDGFALDSREYRLERININRRKIDSGSNVLFAKRGVWHSGWVTAIHRLGYVGLTITVIFQLIVCVYVVRLCMNIRGVANYEYFYFILIPIIPDIILFHYSAGTYTTFFAIFHKLSIMKLTYVLAVKEGIMSPMFSKQKYVPMMLQEVEGAHRKSEEDSALPA